MKITKIEQQKKNENRVNVYCDDKFAFGLTKNGLIDFYIYVGKEIDNEYIEEIKQKDNVNNGINYAMTYLGYGMKTTSEIRKKLIAKGIEEEYIESVIEKLKSYGYVNDNVYIETYIKTKAMPSKWGRQKIIQNLLQKGLEKKQIEEIINNCEEFNSNKNDIIIELAQKKYDTLTKETNVMKKKDKIYRYLLSRGYSWDEISDIWNKLDI